MKYFNVHQLTTALVLTYVNALCGVFGIIAVTTGHLDVAFILLVAAALFDAFDGVVARLKKQTPSQKRMGTVADSIADMISFGVLPSIIFIAVCSLNVVTGVIALVYVFAAIHRLALFTSDALQTNAPTRYFTGLPVVMGAVLLPIGQVLLGSFSWFESFLTVLVLAIALLFIAKLQIPKPHGSIAYASYLLIAGLVITGIIIW